MTEFRTDPDRPAVQFDESRQVWVIRASALGGCVRGLIAAGRDVAPAQTPEWMQKKFDEGHDAEGMISEWYFKQLAKDAGREELSVLQPGGAADVDPMLKWDGHQFGVMLEVSGRIIIEGHVDDLVVTKFGEKMHLAEYKYLAESSRSDVVSKGAEVIAAYPWQISVYLLATYLPLEFVTVFKVKDGDLTKPDWDRTIRKMYTPEDPPRSLDDIIKRATMIIDWIENKGYGEYPECDVDQYPCPFFVLHDEEVVPELDEDEAPNMKLAMGLLDESKALAKKADDMKVDAYKLIKKVLNDRATVMLDGTRITWVHTDASSHMSEPKPAKLVKVAAKDYPKITPPKKTEDND